MKNIITTALFVWLSCASFAAPADDAEQAMQASQQIIALIAENKLNTLWDTRVSKWFKDRMGKNVFIANLSQGRASVGGARLSSQVVDVTYSSQDPQMGGVYTCRFLTKYPLGSFYESVVVIKEPDGQFRLAGVWAAPAPTD
jgi:Protein of unknown function (DUF4019)